MASEKPQNQSPNENSNLDAEREEALKKALLKLKQQGKIKDLPADLFGDDEAESAGTLAEEAEPASQTSTTAEDVAESEAEKASWSAVLSGWDTTPQRLEKEERKRKTAEQMVISKQDTSEVAVVVTPEQDEQIAKVAADAAESEKWGNWDTASTSGDESDAAILDDWAMPEVIDEPHAEKSVVVRKQISPEVEPEANIIPVHDTPWTLQQFFNGEIDLDVELQKRFPAIPIVSAVKFRTLGSDAQRRVATLTATDGTAAVIIDADTKSKEIQISFTFGSMLTLRYSLRELSDADRARWIELMRREKGGLAFLWGPTRWQKDYLICISRQYATKIYAFSPNNFESAARLTQEVMDEVVNWLDEIWTFKAPDDNDDTPLITW